MTEEPASYSHQLLADLYRQASVKHRAVKITCDCMFRELLIQRGTVTTAINQGRSQEFVSERTKSGFRHQRGPHRDRASGGVSGKVPRNTKNC